MVKKSPWCLNPKISNSVRPDFSRNYEIHGSQKTVGRHTTKWEPRFWSRVIVVWLELGTKDSTKNLPTCARISANREVLVTNRRIYLLPLPFPFNALTIFSGLIGSSLIRTPVASVTAFANVANVGVSEGSPTPFAP